MATSFVPAAESLSDFTRARARAEAREVIAMLAYRDAETARTST